MNWALIGHIADILGIVSFVFSFFSLIISGFVLAKLRRQKNQYRRERKELYTDLTALRENIWDDGLTDIRTRDKLHSKVQGFRMKYWMLSSPICHYHVFQCIKLLAHDDFDTNSKAIRNHLNYIIARLEMKE